MGLEINLTPADIEELVKRTILESGFGKAVEDSIRAAMNPNHYNNPVKGAIETYVKKVMLELLETQYSTRVRAYCQKVIEETVTDELLEKVTKTAVDKLERLKEDY